MGQMRGKWCVANLWHRYLAKDALWGRCLKNDALWGRCLENGALWGRCLEKGALWGRCLEKVASWGKCLRKDLLVVFDGCYSFVMRADTAMSLFRKKMKCWLEQRCHLYSVQEKD